MKPYTLALLAASLTACLPLSLAVCFTSTMPQLGEDVELLLESGEILRGVLLEQNREHLIVMRSGFLPSKRKVPCSEITGIRRSGEPSLGEFSIEQLLQRSQELSDSPVRPPGVIRIKVYDRLPLMAVAIAGGVFAGDRLAKASSERDLAKSLDKLGLHDEAKKLESDAASHKGQALFGIVIAGIGIFMACTPSYEEIPLPVVSARTGDLGAVQITLDLARLGRNAPRSSTH